MMFSQEIVWTEHAMEKAFAKTPHAFVTLAGWVQIVSSAMKPFISVFLIALDTESSTSTLANVNAILNGLEETVTSVSILPFSPWFLRHYFPTKRVERPRRGPFNSIHLLALCSFYAQKGAICQKGLFRPSRLNTRSFAAFCAFFENPGFFADSCSTFTLRRAWYVLATTLVVFCESPRAPTSVI